MREIGSLTKVPIREVWPNEAADLTPWLAENPDILSEALGVRLELVDTEVQVGESFSADILFRVRNANALVVVENMMGPTDHDHLGKTITYALRPPVRRRGLRPPTRCSSPSASVLSTARRLRG